MRTGEKDGKWFCGYEWLKSIGKRFVFKKNERISNIDSFHHLLIIFLISFRCYG